MHILLYEYFASGTPLKFGGLTTELIESGFAMVEALLMDLSQVAELQVYTMLDSRLKERVNESFNRKKVHLIWNEAGEHYRSDKFEGDILSEFVARLNIDGVILIAPETNSVLARLTALLERKGISVLGSEAAAISLVSHKGRGLTLLQKAGLPVPKTKIVTKPPSLREVHEILNEFSFPFVCKPAEGTGGQGVAIIRHETHLRTYLENATFLTPILVQDYIPGEAASVSCLVHEHQVLPLSLNQQILHGEDELLFAGITITKEHPQSQEAFQVAIQACTVIRGLKGFVGVDMVLTSTGPVLMEINPRFTMAYPALRLATSHNLAFDHIQACLGNNILNRIVIHEETTLRLNKEYPFTSAKGGERNF